MKVVMMRFVLITKTVELVKHRLFWSEKGHGQLLLEREFGLVAFYLM